MFTTRPATRFPPRTARGSRCAAVALHRTNLSAAAPIARLGLRPRKQSIPKVLNKLAGVERASSKAGCRLAKSDLQNNSLRHRRPLNVGTLTPAVLRFSVLIVFLCASPNLFARTIRVMTYNIHVGV